jgi:hypothetical protein
MFRFGYHAALPIPAAFLGLLGLVVELAEHTRGLAGLLPLLGSFMHLRSDNPPQPLIARQPEQKLYAIIFAPTHQLVPAEAGVSAQDDLHFRPGQPDLRDDSADFRKTAERGVVMGFPQPRSQNMLSAEDVQWQITIVAVIAVEEPPFLVACKGRSVVSTSRMICSGAFGKDSRNTCTSSSSMASFQNVIFLYRSLVPAPSPIRFSVLLPASGSSRFSRPARSRTPDPSAVARDR